MMVANNADDYAAARQNRFFTAHNQTPADGNLTGQCVTLVKWFLSEMTGVPAPFAARGDARYVGKTLVAQGHAYEVPYDQRQRGDIVCLEYGVYGHIYVQLSGRRVFEENVKWSGVASRLVDGATVYASRIGSDAETWRHDMHVYRLYSYKEGDMAEKITEDTSKILQHAIIARNGLRGRAYALDGSTGTPWVGGDLSNKFISDVFSSPEAAAWRDSPDFPSVNGINVRLDRLPVAEAALSSATIQVGELTKTVEAKDKVIDVQQKQIEALKAQVGDNSKWETLKALIRELVGIAPKA